MIVDIDLVDKVNCLLVDMYLVVDMQEDTMDYCHQVVVEDKMKVVADMGT